MPQTTGTRGADRRVAAPILRDAPDHDGWSEGSLVFVA
jgi:hypothetical protein